MLFRTELSSMYVENKIGYSSKVLFIGSCFSSNIGDLLKARYFDVMINPFGTVYNPVSIVRQLEYVISKSQISENDLSINNGLYVHHDFHSDFNSENRSQVISKINKSIIDANAFFKTADYVFITLGSSWVYELKETRTIVANCHKRSDKLFEKKLLDMSEISTSLNYITSMLEKLNPNINIVFTLSPVRHIKDGIVENSISKSQLRVAVFESVKAGYSYFPSYEYMMDDLRDYRFYEEDLIHPNRMAIKYIWEKFCESYCDKSTIEKIKKIEKINQFLNHRPTIIKEEYEVTKSKMLEELKLLITQS